MKRNFDERAGMYIEKICYEFSLLMSSAWFVVKTSVFG